VTQTLLVALAHPDDELGVAGTILAQRARGDRVVVLWLTRGEMTEAFGPLPPSQVARKRVDLGHRAGELLDVETRFLELPDTHLTVTHEAVDAVAREIADVRPDGVITWGDAWTRGMRHPDHQSCGKIVRDAVTVARIAKRVTPLSPHRNPVPVFTFRDEHSRLPEVTVDVTPYRDGIHELADLYRKALGFGDPKWLDLRLKRAGEAHGFTYGESLDAWETGGGAVDTLLPPLAAEGALPMHPDRPQERDSS